MTVNTVDPIPVDPACSLPGLLTQAGYQTRAQGKMHFEPRRCNYGFEHMELLEDYYRYMAKHPHLGIPADHGLCQNELEPGISTVSESNSLTHWIVDRSVDFLETRDDTRPFFLWTSFSKPHPPLDPCANYWMLYQNADVPYPVHGDWSLTPDDVPTGMRAPTWRLNNCDRFSPELLRESKRAYYAVITQIDYNLGRLFARLKELGLDDNTIIIFTSDHGEMLGDHHLGAKSCFLEGASHVPMLVYVPPALKPVLPGGSHCDELVELTDVYRTCLGIAGVQIPADHICDGLDLREIADGSVRRERFEGQCGTHHAVIEGDIKYIYCEAGPVELMFDLKNDPYEQYDLAHKDEHAELLEKMRQYLLNRLGASELPVVECLKEQDIRGFWPGFHSREQPGDVMH
jgi:arylsulfatase A-like enzyme